MNIRVLVGREALLKGADSMRAISVYDNARDSQNSFAKLLSKTQSSKYQSADDRQNFELYKQLSIKNYSKQEWRQGTHVIENTLFRKNKAEMAGAQAG